VNWTERTSRTTGTSNQLFGVAYGNGTFVAVGGFFFANIILTSPDGVNWTERTSRSKTLNSVTYGKGLFVAVGNGGTILTSP
jgi:hypothetical protein